MTLNIPDKMKPAFERSSHPFHVWDGLVSTPKSLENVLADNVEKIKEIARNAKNRDYIHFIGCGSSYFSSIAGTYFFHEVAKIPSSAYEAYEYSAYPVPTNGKGLMVAISHTGSTPVVLDSINNVTADKFTTIGLTDVESSLLASTANYVLVDKNGLEKAIPKTRSYVASLLKHFLLATEIAAVRNHDVSDILNALKESPKVAEDVLKKSETFTKQLASTMKNLSRVYAIGAGPNTATAYEAALKLQETVQIPANGWQLEEGMHGPWVSMKENDLVIVIAAKGPSLEKTNKFISSIKKIGTKVWVITNEQEGNPDADYITYLPTTIPEVVSPLYSILPIYQFAYQLALARSIHPDIMGLDNGRYLETRLTLPR